MAIDMLHPLNGKDAGLLANYLLSHQDEAHVEKRMICAAMRSVGYDPKRDFMRLEETGVRLPDGRMLRCDVLDTDMTSQEDISDDDRKYRVYIK